MDGEAIDPEELDEGADNQAGVRIAKDEADHRGRHNRPGYHSL